MIATVFLQIVDELASVSDIDALQKISAKISVRFFIDFLSVLFLIRFVYFPAYKKRELFFTFFMFNVVIFFICFLLNKVDLSMGAAFGLFAVFSMLRYRTEDISIKDMSYLFLVIALGLISAVTKIKGASETYELIFIGAINTLIVLVAFFLENKVFFKKEVSKIVIYENVDLIHSQNQSALVEDIKKRTGINVSRISIQKIDFLNDSAVIKVYYFE